MGGFSATAGKACAHQTGFSLYDTLIALAIISVVSTVGVAGARELIERHQLLIYANLLIGDLHLARNEAIKRGHAVTLCKSDNGRQCTTQTSWESGWIVFADANKNHEVDSEETVIHVQQMSADNLSLRYGETGTYRYVTYYPSGFAAPNATFTLCRKRNAKNAKGVIVYWTGRARIAYQKSDGSPLKCK